MRYLWIHFGLCLLGPGLTDEVLQTQAGSWSGFKCSTPLRPSLQLFNSGDELNMNSGKQNAVQRFQDECRELEEEVMMDKLQKSFGLQEQELNKLQASLDELVEDFSIALKEGVVNSAKPNIFSAGSIKSLLGETATGMIKTVMSRTSDRIVKLFSAPSSPDQSELENFGLSRLFEETDSCTPGQNSLGSGCSEDMNLNFGGFSPVGSTLLERLWKKKSLLSNRCTSLSPLKAQLAECREIVTVHREKNKLRLKLRGRASVFEAPYTGPQTRSRAANV